MAVQCRGAPSYEFNYDDYARITVSIMPGYNESNLRSIISSYNPVAAAPGVVHSFAGIQTSDDPYVQQFTQYIDIGFGTPPMPARTFSITIPVWELILITAAMPVGLLAAKLHRAGKTRLLRPGLCRNCGYDLRATPDFCPECGTTPPHALASHAPVRPIELRPPAWEFSATSFPRP